MLLIGLIAIRHRERAILIIDKQFGIVLIIRLAVAALVLFFAVCSGIKEIAPLLLLTPVEGQSQLDILPFINYIIVIQVANSYNINIIHRIFIK